MGTQKTKKSTQKTMENKYGDDVEHKHDKDHLEYRGHEKSHGHHLHGGISDHKGTHHHHKAVHHHHHYYGPVTIHMSSEPSDMGEETVTRVANKRY